MRGKIGLIRYKQHSQTTIWPTDATTFLHYNYHLTLQINLFSSANQFTFLSKSIYFPQQINLFSSANSLKLQTKFIDFTQQIHWICKQTDRFKWSNWLILCGFNDTQKHTPQPTISIPTAYSHHRQTRWRNSMMPLYILPLSIPRWRAEKYITDYA